MATKRISDLPKLESLTENDALLVAHEGDFARVSQTVIKPQKKKPVLYWTKQGGFLMKGDAPNGEYVTLDEALEAFYGGGLYYWVYSSRYPTPQSNEEKPFERCISFFCSGGGVALANGKGVISGATLTDMMSKSNEYFA